MSITRSVKRLFVTGLAGAMVLSLMPAGVAAADVIDTSDVPACDGSEGLVEFNDNLGSAASDIECMAAYGITVGDTAGNFNQTRVVNRQQMALFIARLAAQAIDGDPTAIPTSADDEFDDIDGISPPEARDAINWLADLGITTGTSGGDSYNPGGDVTRQQMASFIARAHVALEVDFSEVEDEADEDAFPDADQIADVHIANVALLQAAGVVEGRTDGTFGPGAGVTRSQMSRFVVRSIFILDAQGLWNGQFIVEDEDVVPADIIVVAAATGDDTVYLSDGDAVTEYEYTGDSFAVNGVASSKLAFEAFLNANLENDEVSAIQIETTVDGDDVTHDVSLSGPVLSGVIGQSGDGLVIAGEAADFAIVDGPSGVALTEITEDVAFGVPGELDTTFTVDGNAVGEAAFIANLNVGDFIDVDVVAVDEDGDPTALRHNLTNATLTGESLNGELPAVVDPNSDDDADVNTLDLMPLFETGPDFATSTVYVIDGESSGDDGAFVVGDFNTALQAGAEISYSVVAGVATYTVETEPAPVFEAFTGTVIDATNVAVDADTVLEVDYAANATYVVDGTVVTAGEFNDALTFGDTLACTAGELDENVDAVCSSVSLTNVEQISGAVTKDAEGGLVFVLANGYEVAIGEEVVAGGYQITLDAEEPYLINGESEFKADFPATTGEDVPVTAVFVVAALDAVPYDVVNVTGTLTHDDGADGVWSFAGLNNGAIQAGIQAELAE